MTKKIIGIIIAAFMILSLAACGAAKTSDNDSVETLSTAHGGSSQIESQSSQSSSNDSSTASANVSSSGAIDATDLFTDRDMKQTADTSEATNYSLSDGKDITITSAGVYVFSGSAENATIIVDAGDDDKVQIVLDSVTITNDDFPAIYVKNADKTFVTTTGSTSTLTVSGSFKSDGNTNTDAVIFSKDDLVLNGTGTLKISSTDNGITSKDDLKVTGGTIIIDCTSDALEANDSIAIAGGDITITTQKDGLHAENDDDNTKGYVYICGGTFNITATSDGIQGTTVVQIDDGIFSISARECIEGTYIQINGGTLDLTASDDGLNASNKSKAYTPTIEINGGDITIDMGQGDTDAVDSNGYLYVNGGTINISAQFAFDFENSAEYNGGTIIVNGEQITEITNSMFGGGGGFGGPMSGGFQGGPGGMNDGNQGGFGGPGGRP
ncbi:MAG: carbohydrate-binding domain-containing protein [Lachnospiraceae bacterium]|nr:carbohydrate-binding domain-containing protein [Lachnospiraceae bacterium]